MDKERLKYALKHTIIWWSFLFILSLFISHEGSIYGDKDLYFFLIRIIINTFIFLTLFIGFYLIGNDKEVKNDNSC